MHGWLRKRRWHRISKGASNNGREGVGNVAGKVSSCHVNIWLNLLQTPLLLPMLTGQRSSNSSSSSSNRATTRAATTFIALHSAVLPPPRLMQRISFGFASRVARLSRLCRQVVAANYAKKLVKLIKTKPQREVAKANTPAHTHTQTHAHPLPLSLASPHLPLLAYGKMLKCDDVENATAGGKQLEQGHNMFCRISTHKYSLLTSPPYPRHLRHARTHTQTQGDVAHSKLVELTKCPRLQHRLSSGSFLN